MSWGRAAALWLVAIGLVVLARRPEGGGPDVSPDVAAPVPSSRPAPAIALAPPIRAVEIRRGEAVVAWERGTDGVLRVVAPERHSIAPGLLSAFTDQLAEVGASESFDGDPADPGFGLEAPSLRVSATGADGQKVAFVVGARTPSGTSVYARRADGGPIVLVGLNLLYYSDLLFEAAR